MLVLTIAWFWVVSAHRIHDAPYVKFAYAFVTGCGDFEHFYWAGAAMRAGTDIYRSGVGGYIYPPLIAALYSPLSRFSVQTAAWVALVCNLGLVLACAWVGSKEVLRRMDIAISNHNVIMISAVATLLAATRLRGEVQMWQTNLLLMLGVLLALRFLDRRPLIAGLCLGFAINIKYLPLVYLPYLMLRRRYAAAASTLVGTATFALAPALISGWQANLDALRVAASGVMHLVGIAVAVPESANIDPITAGHSLSITSGIARVLGPGADPALAVRLGLACAGLFALLIWGVYRLHRMPLFRWPDAKAQRDSPYSAMVAVEWMSLMALALAFSPQTNPRHTSLLFMAYLPLAAMLCVPVPAGAGRKAALVATLVVTLGFMLPPHLPAFAPETTWWLGMGGPGWCMAVLAPLMANAAMHYRAPEIRRVAIARVPATAWPPRRGGFRIGAKAEVQNQLDSNLIS